MARYNVSKLLNILIVREFSAQLNQSTKSKVILNCLNPGFCKSELSRDHSTWALPFINLFKAFFARTTEVGSRNLVYAAGAGTETHGQYLGDCEIKM
jgi:retinol dehydrogenase 12